jgi:hypothetical protein
MKDLKFFRSVCSWGHVLFSILRVLSLLGAIGLLLGILMLVAWPQNTFSVDTSMKMDIKVNFARILGREWAEVKEELYDEIDTSLPEGAEITEDGIQIEQGTPSISMENRVFALSLIPAFVEMILAFSLYRFLGKTFKILKQAPNPFDAEAAKHLRTAGTFLMVQAVLPALCMSLVTLLTKVSGYFETEFDLFSVFLGFLIWALSDLFLYAKEKISAPLSSPPPFGGFPAETEPEKQDSDIHPDAF